MRPRVHNVPQRSLAGRIRGRHVEPRNDDFTKAQELRSFLFLSVVMAPILAVMIVGGYGFLVWMYQLLAGPPGS